jgi:Gpi18-like mannosyltransferase
MKKSDYIFIPLRENPGRKASVGTRSVFASARFRARRSLGEDTPTVRLGSFILVSILGWLGLLAFILFWAVKFIPVASNFLGGGLSNYQTNPFLWVWGNFDGEHYIAIAQNGYQPLTYFFFPLYPLLIKYVSIALGSGILVLQKTGVFISLASFSMAVIGLTKLLKLDYKDNRIKAVVLLLLVFPTSFFFAGVYTESLFLALAVWSFYFMRQEKWLLAGILIGLATATRIIGLALVAALVVEALPLYRGSKFRNIFRPSLGILTSLLGIGIYIYYLWIKTGDPLNFLHTVSIFGPQRSADFILLPQVFYRYIFKVLPNLNYTVISSFFPSVLEFAVAGLFLVLSILSFWKVRLSYAIFLSLGYLVPTLSGSFSSLPRYVLVLFPGFLVLAMVLRKKQLMVAFSFISFILLTICFALFSRGYWIS